MSTIQRVLVNILSDRLPETRDFFTGLLGFQTGYDTDWYVQVSAPDNPALEVGIWRRDHELVPEPYRRPPQGVILTVVVDDVDAVHERAIEIDVEVVEPPRDRFYGQRGCLLLDPNGLLVDVSTPVNEVAEVAASPAGTPTA